MRTGVLLAVIAVIAACRETTDSFLAPDPTPESVSPMGTGASSAFLGGLRRSTASFHDVDKAVEAGYLAPEATACVGASGLGAMGVHSVNFLLALDLEIDALRPEVLLYLPKTSGGFRLVGVEYVVAALVMTPAGPAPWFEDSEPPYPFFNPAPVVFGETFEGPMPGHEPGQPWHYDKHVWAWATNPNGMFAQFNPALSCPGSGS